MTSSEFNLEQIVRQKLLEKFPDADIETAGSYSDGAHIQVSIISEKFKNLSLLEQHSLVNEALSDLLADRTIHALKIKTRAK